MKKIKIYPEQSITNRNVTSILSNKGYKEVNSKFENIGDFKLVLEKDNKIYGVLEWNHFNHNTKSITLIEVDDIYDLNVCCKEMILKELEDRLMDDSIMTLKELSKTCVEITESTRPDIFEHDLSQLGDNEGGYSFSWGKDQDQEGIYTIDFTIVEEDEEDWGNNIIQVTDIWII